MEQFTHLHGSPRYSIGRDGEKKLFDKELKRIRTWAREQTGVPVEEAVRRLFGSERQLRQKVRLHSEYYRIAYRAIASSTNRRTMIATVLPKEVYCGHSLIAAIPFRWTKNGQGVRLRENCSSRELLVITSLLNSFVVDFTLRRKTHSNISMFLVYQLPCLRLSEETSILTICCVGQPC